MAVVSKESNDDMIGNSLKFLDKPIGNTYYTVGDLFNRPEIIRHPIDYMTTLVQLGYEPLPPKLAKTIFGRTQLQLPGFYSYLKYIAKTDGFWGIYRGLTFNLTYSISYSFVYINVVNFAKNTKLFEPIRQKNTKYSNPTNLALSLACDTISRFAAHLVSYPIHVMMVRSMAQFIGRETYYNSIFSAFCDINQTGGIGGFYSGFVPFLLGDCILLYLESCLIYAIHDSKYIDQMLYPFIVSSISIIARSLIYPFRIVSTVMSCNGNNARSLAASAYTAPQYDNWVQCWGTLMRRGEIKRGSSLIWRYQPLTSSLAFNVQPMTGLDLKNKKDW